MENIFAADIPAASTSAHRLRYWKIEESANRVTAQVYFLEGNISFDPVREEYVVSCHVLAVPFLASMLHQLSSFALMFLNVYTAPAAKKVAAIMSSTPSPPHLSVSEAVSWVCKQGLDNVGLRGSIS